MTATVWSTFGRRLVQLPGISALATWLVSIGAIREKLTANRTYYVRTDGSDSNTGLVNSSGGAFLTINKALTTVQALDISTFNVTIQVGAGTYTTAVSLTNGWTGTGTVTLFGDATTPTNCYINVTGTAVSMTDKAKLTMSGFRVAATANNFNISNGSSLTLSNMEYAGGTSCLRSTYDSLITISGANHTINANYAAFLNGLRGSFNGFGATITLSGTPAFSAAFAFLDTLSFALLSSMTFSGSATGVRYSITLNSVAQTNGGGATYLPGNAGGSTATGGQYA